MRHRTRRRLLHPRRHYVSVVLTRGGTIDAQGRRTPEQTIPLPRALFAPGTSTEQGLLSDVSEQRAQLFFHDPVDVRSDDSLTVQLDSGSQKFSVDGYPKIWPQGIEVVLVRVP